MKSPVRITMTDAPVRLTPHPMSPMHVHPGLMKSVRRLVRAETRCYARLAEAASLTEKWGAAK